MIYNDKAVLENFHASAVFRIMKDENYNVLANLKKDEYRSVKKTCQILAYQNKSYFVPCRKIDVFIVFLCAPEFLDAFI